jgi:CheY-like chemotaxis protein
MDDSPGQKTVVVVDDEADIVSSISQLLELAFPQVRVVGTLSPAEALELAEQGVELLLTDYRMPAMDGLELARRAQAADESLPILLVTAYADPFVQEKAEAIGVEVLRKPIDVDQFIGAVRLSLG